MCNYTKECIGLNAYLYTFPITDYGAELYERMMDELSRRGKVEPWYVSNAYAFVHYAPRRIA